MKRIVLPSTLLLATFVFTACEQSRVPTEVGDVEASFNSKKPGGSTETDPIATFYLPATNDNGALALWGDGKSVKNGMSEYWHQVCGVETRFYYTGSGDAILNSVGHKGSASKCKNAPRQVKINFSSPVEAATPKGDIETVSAWINTFQVQNTTSSIAVTDTVLRDMNVNFTGSQYCDGLRFRTSLPAYPGVSTVADQVQVTRESANRWRVHSQDGFAKAACLKNDALVGHYNIPVDFYIVTDRNLPE